MRSFIRALVASFLLTMLALLIVGLLLAGPPSSTPTRYEDQLQQRAREAQSLQAEEDEARLREYEKPGPPAPPERFRP